MVDHTFLFTGAVKKIRQLVDEGALGDLYYYDSLRVNLGLFQHDVNVIWDLAPHDLSIMDYVIKEKPEAVVATGESHLNGVEDIAFITVYFPKHIIAHINVNWLSPVKVRTTLIGGEKKMLVWNDLEADEKIKIYDKGVSMSTNPSNLHNCWSAIARVICGRPKSSRSKRLRAETAYFIECIDETRAVQRRRCRPARGADPRSGGQFAVRSRGEAGDSVNDYRCIAPDVKLGKDVKLSKFINLYGCEIGDETKIGAFVEIQKNARWAAAARSPATPLSAKAWTSRTTCSSDMASRSSTTVSAGHDCRRADCKRKPTGKSKRPW